MKIIVADIIHDEVAAFHEEGLLVFEQLKASFARGERVVLSFKGITQCSTQFLNAAIGKLYLEYGEEFVSPLLSYEYGSLEQRLPGKLDDVKWCALNTTQYNAIVEEAICH
jgi:hypothetical protein